MPPEIEETGQGNLAYVMSWFRLSNSRSRAGEKKIILTEELRAELHRRIFKADDGSISSELENGRKAAARINAWGAWRSKKSASEAK